MLMSVIYVGLTVGFKGMQDQCYIKAGPILHPDGMDIDFAFLWQLYKHSHLFWRCILVILNEQALNSIFYTDEETEVFVVF